jgi:hypothetical protein
MKNSFCRLHMVLINFFIGVLCRRRTAFLLTLPRKGDRNKCEVVVYGIQSRLVRCTYSRGGISLLLFSLPPQYSTPFQWAVGLLKCLVWSLTGSSLPRPIGPQWVSACKSNLCQWKFWWFRCIEIWAELLRLMWCLSRKVKCNFSFSEI